MPIQPTQINLHPRIGGKLNIVIQDLPGDKSISHRAVILGALATNISRFTHFLFSEDCLNTMAHFKAMGVDIHAHAEEKTIEIHGVGLNGLKAPQQVLECGNSGTSIRLMLGLLAGQPFSSTLTGDRSILSRPMRRVIDPLVTMGANIQGTRHSSKPDLFPPVSVLPTSSLKPIRYTLPVASAQVKSALLLASLYSQEESEIIEPEICRDHTERMLTYYGAAFRKEGTHLYCSGVKPLVNPSQMPVAIPADISSAAFFIVLGSIFPHSNLILKGVGLNPTRDGILRVLKRMGAKITIASQDNSLEPRGDLIIETAVLQNVSILPEEIPLLIDELPILAIAALFASGQMSVRGAEELRHKESDRIETIKNLVIAMKGQVVEYPDGFDLYPPETPILPFEIHSKGDHRIAMSAMIGAIAAGVEATIMDCECIQTSFPNFMDILGQIGVTWRASK